MVADKLSSGVVRIYPSSVAFAALKTDGSVVTWGFGVPPSTCLGCGGGDSSPVASQLTGVVSFADPFNNDRLS